MTHIRAILPAKDASEVAGMLAGFGGVSGIVTPGRIGDAVGTEEIVIVEFYTADYERAGRCLHFLMGRLKVGSCLLVEDGKPHMAVREADRLTLKKLA